MSCHLLRNWKTCPRVTTSPPGTPSSASWSSRIGGHCESDRNRFWPNSTQGLSGISWIRSSNRLLPPKCQRRISRYKHTFYPTNANDGYQGMNILFTTQMPMTDIKVWTYFLPHKCQWQISRYEQTFTTQMPMTEISRLMQMFTFKNIWQFTTMKMCSGAIFCQTSCKI